MHVKPKVDSVTVASTPAANGIYRTGETIQMDLTFDKAVAVFTTFGTPEVWFVMDGSNPGRREAAYATTVGDDVVRFEYVVQAGDSDLDGILFMNSAIVWNDGAIIRKEHGDVDDLDELKNPAGGRKRWNHLHAPPDRPQGECGGIDGRDAGRPDSGRR